MIIDLESAFIGRRLLFERPPAPSCLCLTPKIRTYALYAARAGVAAMANKMTSKKRGKSFHGCPQLKLSIDTSRAHPTSLARSGLPCPSLDGAQGHRSQER